MNKESSLAKEAPGGKVLIVPKDVDERTSIIQQPLFYAATTSITNPGFPLLIFCVKRVFFFLLFQKKPTQGLEKFIFQKDAVSSLLKQLCFSGIYANKGTCRWNALTTGTFLVHKMMPLAELLSISLQHSDGKKYQYSLKRCW